MGKNVIAGSTDDREAPMGYALWRFSGKNWELKKNASLKGAVPSAPPQQSGEFVGQMRSTPSVSA